MKNSNLIKLSVWQEPRHDKTSKMSVCPAKTQISLDIRPVWSETSLSAWRKLWSLATLWSHIEDCDRTGRMHRLIWFFAGRSHFVGFVMSRLKSLNGLKYTNLCLSRKYYTFPTKLQKFIEDVVDANTFSGFKFSYPERKDIFTFVMSGFSFISIFISANSSSTNESGRFAHFPVRPWVVSHTFPFAPSRFAPGSFRPLSRPLQTAYAIRIMYTLFLCFRIAFHALHLFLFSYLVNYFLRLGLQSEKDTKYTSCYP